MRLSQFDEVEATGSRLTPFELNGRVLAKGKVKMKRETLRDSRESDSRKSEPRSPVTARIRLLRSMGSSLTVRGAVKRQTEDDNEMIMSPDDNEMIMSPNVHDAERARLQMLATRRFEGKASRASQPARAGVYVSCLTFRSIPFKKWLEGEPPWPLTIASVGEDLLLKELGLSKTERNLIEGLNATRSTPGLAEAQLAHHSLVRMAANPPSGAGRLQRLTAKVALRSFPLGPRFSGTNFSPLPSWLTGAQHVAYAIRNRTEDHTVAFRVASAHAESLVRSPMVG